MGSVQPWMRLKVKADTFFLPDADGTVYFRNNAGSFRMEGTSVQSWIEKLLPVLNGQHTLASLTDGLPAPYQDRIYEVAGILYANGFVRDVSEDAKHQLSEQICAYYAPQIEFVDHLIGSGASRFQTYRNANVLAIGSGAPLVSLVGALLESGLSTVHMVGMDADGTNLQRLEAFLASSQRLDIRAAIRDFTHQVSGSDALREAVETMDAVVYISPTGDMDTLREIESFCSQAHKWFLPAICLERLGIVGPLLKPTDASCVITTWDAMWRRIHPSVFQHDLHVSGFASTAGAVLANVLVFELFKAITGVEEADAKHHFYTLDFETLEGKWHDFIPGQMELGHGEARFIANLQDQLTTTTSTNMADVLAYFAKLTDSTSGIFHIWDEGGLTQLPLAQCRVQPIHPFSPGPAELLVETVCAGLTHEEARREAGIAGIEDYALQLNTGSANDGQFIGVGAGITTAEAIGRGLLRCLMNELTQTLQHTPATIQLVELKQIHDEKCKYYFETMCAVGMDPIVGLGPEVLGFPVVWVGSHGRFVGSVGFCVGMAFQRALEYTLLREIRAEEDGAVRDARWVVVEPAHALSEAAAMAIEIEPWLGFDAHHAEVVSAVEALARQGKEVTVLDLALEPFLTEMLASVFGVSIRQGASR